ncbi:MAG: hypothetical protein Q9162_007955 [Coniocarpon cinnabarinum]
MTSMTPLFSPPRRWSVAVLVVLAGLFYLAFDLSFLSHRGLASTYLTHIRQSEISGSACVANLTLLQSLNITRPDQKSVNYAQLCLAPSFTAGTEQKLSVQQLDIDLPELRSIPFEVGSDTSSILSSSSHDLDTSSVQHSVALPRVPAKRPDASHILFGVATTVKRLNDSLPAFRHWASGNGARIHAVVESSEGVQETLQRAEAMDIKLDISESTAKMDDRYFSHIAMFPSLKSPNTRWMAFIDDDTFFLSMPALIQMLDRYDPSQPHYVGGLSENSDQVASWGLWAYGGAGVFLSTPLMDELYKVYDECFAVGFTADWRISQCIYQHTTTKLSWEQSLHQMDLAMDQSGFYESGRQLPLSIHHWKSWIHLDVVAMATVSRVCGVECVLKRLRLRDGWILTNGFSIVQYSNGWSGQDATVERTWESWDGKHNQSPGANFLHSLGPLRAKDEKKRSYRLKAASVDGKVVRQFYVSHDNVEPNSVIEVCWHAS